MKSAIKKIITFMVVAISVSAANAEIDYADERVNKCLSELSIPAAFKHWSPAEDDPLDYVQLRILGLKSISSYGDLLSQSQIQKLKTLRMKEGHLKILEWSKTHEITREGVAQLMSRGATCSEVRVNISEIVKESEIISKKFMKCGYGDVTEAWFNESSIARNFGFPDQQEAHDKALMAAHSKSSIYKKCISLISR